MSKYFLINFQYKKARDFPGGPVAKALPFQHRGHGFNQSANSIQHAMTKTCCRPKQKVKGRFPKTRMLC